MQFDPTRLLRLRLHAPLARSTRGRAAASRPRGTPRFLGQVVGGAAMPGGTDQFYLMNPVRLDGPETEGAAASAAGDATRVIPVVIIGARPPQAGDLLVAMAVGGR